MGYPVESAGQPSVAELARVNAGLRAEIADLKARLHADSSNSSRPPLAAQPGELGEPQAGPEGHDEQRVVTPRAALG